MSLSRMAIFRNFLPFSRISFGFILFFPFFLICHAFLIFSLGAAVVTRDFHYILQRFSQRIDPLLLVVTDCMSGSMLNGKLDRGEANQPV